MEQNLFTEGVRPGSVTTPEEVHMLICYIFREAGQPVTLDQVNEVLQRQSLVNYFEFAEAAERLIRMGHLRPAENGRYTLSPEGEKLADTFRQPLTAQMTIAIEPKIALAGIGLVGTENTYLVTPAGGVSLTGQAMGLREIGGRGIKL